MCLRPAVGAESVLQSWVLGDIHAHGAEDWIASFAEEVGGQQGAA